jgi:hypothetical protein
LNDVNYLPLSVLRLADDLINLDQVLYGKTSAVDRVRSSDSDTHVGLFDRYEVVGTVAYHADLETALAEEPLKK